MAFCSIYILSFICLKFFIFGFWVTPIVLMDHFWHPLGTIWCVRGGIRVSCVQYNCLTCYTISLALFILKVKEHWHLKENFKTASKSTQCNHLYQLGPFCPKNKIFRNYNIEKYYIACLIPFVINHNSTK